MTSYYLQHVNITIWIYKAPTKIIYQNHIPNFGNQNHIGIF